MGAGASQADALNGDARPAELRRRLLALGFDAVHFADVGELTAAGALRSWLADGMHAEMGWMDRSADKRTDPALVLPGVRSVVALGVNYGPESSPAAGPRWARYAGYEDYHDTLKPALVAAGRVLEELYGVTSEDYRYYVDAGPVLERAWAARSGVGFIGKNAMLISPEWGNWLFLAAILTRVELPACGPVRGAAAGGIGALCGRCDRCLKSCPTGALVRPGVIDARRCVSYLTIEHKGAIPREWRGAIGDRLYGCDDCAAVCPWNRFSKPSRSALLVSRPECVRLPLREILELTPARFVEVFRRTPIKRVKLSGLLRNACVVAGNSGDASLVDLLVRLAETAEPLVRAHAVWAVFRLAGAGRAPILLARARAAEVDALPLAEYAAEGVV